MGVFDDNVDGDDDVNDAIKCQQQLQQHKKQEGEGERNKRGKTEKRDKKEKKILL